MLSYNMLRCSSPICRFSKLFALRASSRGRGVMQQQCARLLTINGPDKVDQVARQQCLQICIEGNIGCGKTSMINYYLQNNSDIQATAEPVDKWRNLDDHNLFGLFYQDPQRWSYLFQSYVLLTMYKRHQHVLSLVNNTTARAILMERSVFSANYCFVENLRAENLMSNSEYRVLQAYFDHFMNTARPRIDVIVYLQCTPEICYERIKRRQRIEESKITLDYIRCLHQRHEEWLIHGKYPLPCPVMVIPVNGNLEEMAKIYNSSIDQILLNIAQQQ